MNNTIKQVFLVCQYSITFSITVNSGDAVGRYTEVEYPCFLQILNTLFDLS